MLNKNVTLLLLLIFISCSKNPKTYIQHLDGYWEIDEVILPDGSKRDYNYNDTIDFIELTDSLTGFRKKLKPNFNGTYTTSDDSESLMIAVENDSLNLYYKTPYAEWKETVLKASADQLVIQNQEKIRYIYKRFEPIIAE